MTATEASRAFKSVLDEVERGETIIVGRGGKRIATIGPTASANGVDVIELFTHAVVDDTFADDIAATRTIITLDEPAWLDE